jgi:arylsulfatase A-like enzyme
MRLAFLTLMLIGAAPAAEKVNVLFIAVDDLNDWIGPLKGHPQTRTPNLDRLAARGVVFTRAYCAAPVCNPSRTALMTGVRPWTSGVYSNDQPWRPALKDAVTLPQHLRGAGYGVLSGGKIFHGGYEDAASWDERAKLPGKNPHPAKTPVNGIPKAAQFDWGAVEEGDEDMPDHRMVTWASEVLQRKHEKPFFLAAGFVKPHLPWYVPKKYFEMFPLDQVTLPPTKEGDLDDVPAAGKRMAKPEGDHASVLKANAWKTGVQGYLASIAFLDAQVGRLLEALEKSAYAKNTVIVFWGDHGWHLGEKSHWRKFALWERATRVPLIVAGPGIAPGTCGRTVDLMDLYPTIVELCGAPAREGIAGDSFVKLLKNPTEAWDRPAVTTHGRANHAVRTEKWRYIRYADGSEELYDEEADPNEWTNVAAAPGNEKIKAELARRLPAKDAPDAPSEKGKKDE